MASGGVSVFTLMLRLSTARQLRDIAMRDVRRRVVLLKPTWWYIGDTLNGGNSDVQFFMGIKAEWAERSVSSQSAVWDVESSSILASYRRRLRIGRYSFYL